MTKFAESLKKLRKETGLSMQSLADEAKVSKSMICKIERDEVQPTLDVAGRLARALGKPLSEMLHSTQATQVVYLPQKEQAIWEDAQKIQRRNISPVFEGLKIEWLQVTMPPKVVISKSAHMYGMGGEKYILVTKGTLNLTLSEKVYKLTQGDSLYFDASCPHEFLNPSNKPVEFYIVVKHAST